MATKKKRKSESVPLITVEPESATSSYNLEKYVLGTILSSPNSLSIAAEHLNHECFSSLAHATIFEAMLRMEEHHVPIDIVPLIEEIRKAQQLEAIGGIVYISSLIETSVYDDHLPAYCQMIVSKWKLRELGRITGNVKQDINAPGAEAEDVLEDVQAKMWELQVVKNYIDRKKQNLDDVRAELKQEPIRLAGLSTGYATLDLRIGGIATGSNSGLTIVAARPKEGKTAFLMNIIVQLCKQKIAIGLQELEMPEGIMKLRFLSILSGVPIYIIRTRQWRRIPGFHDYDNVLTAADTYEQWLKDGLLNMECSERAISIHAFRRKCQRMLRDNSAIQAMFNDQFDWILPPPDITLGYEQAKWNVARMREHPKEFGIPFIWNWQLSRLAVTAMKEKRNLGIPGLDALQGTDSAGRDAENVIIIYRPSAHDETIQDPDARMKTYVNVAACRNGSGGHSVFKYNGAILTFTEIDTNREEPPPRYSGNGHHPEPPKSEEIPFVDENESPF